MEEQTDQQSEPFGKSLARIRKSHDITQEMLSNASGVGQTMIARIELGNIKLPKRSAGKLITSLKAKWELPQKEIRELRSKMKKLLEQEKNAVAKVTYTSHVILNAIFEDYGFSGATIAEDLQGITRQHVSEWRRGILRPSPARLDLLFHVFQSRGVSLSRIREYKIAYTAETIEIGSDFSYLYSQEKRQIINCIKKSL